MYKGPPAKSAIL